MYNAASPYIGTMLSTSVRMYHQLFEQLEKPVLYAYPWWLEATCGAGGWEALICYDASSIAMAALPYHQTKIWGMSAVVTPPLTQWVSWISAKEEKEPISAAFLHELPKSSILDLSLKPDGDTALQDQAFPVNFRYSYILPWAKDADQVRSQYNEGLKRNLRAAEQSYIITETEDVPSFLELCRTTYAQRKLKPPPWLFNAVPRAHAEMLNAQCGKLTFAWHQGKVVAGIMTGWDHATCYYLAGGRTADDHGASAHALLLDHAILESQREGRMFDFEGSMHPGIANFFQSFGGVPVSFWQVRKYRGMGKLWSVFH